MALPTRPPATDGDANGPSAYDLLVAAATHHQAGRLEEADSLYRTVLRLQPGNGDAHHNLGVLAMQRGRGIREALPHFEAAWEADPSNAAHGLSYLRALALSGDMDRARAVHAEGSRRGFAWPSVELLRPGPAPGAHGATPSATSARVPRPDEEDALARAYERQDFRRLESLAQALVERYPQHGLGWKALGVAARKLGRRDDAIASMRQAARLLPQDAEAHANLGSALSAVGLWGEAEAAFRRAAALRPDLAAAHAGLARALASQGRLDDAKAGYRRALALQPSGLEAYHGLGEILMRQDRLEEAEGLCREMAARDPSRAGTHYDLGAILMKQGRLAEAEECFRRALALKPGHIESMSGVLFLHHYAARQPPASLLEESKAFGALATSRAAVPYRAWTCDPSPRRLRVGLVSGDLRQHPVGYFLEGVLARSDPARIEWIAYPTIPGADELSNRLRKAASGWNPIAGLRDEDAARRIHEDGLHVLLDLAGHTANNRLTVFAWRPAPVQATWLGYFATTGLAEMDYLLADRVGVPPALQSQFTERIWYLPQTRLCFTPPEAAPPPAPPPAAATGHVTFGCFQALPKMTDEVLATWSRVLASVPGSRLRLQNKSLADPAARQALGARLEAAGVAPGRVGMHGHAPRHDYLAAHAQVDLLLDTFPYPGGTTTCEALWMGVPTVTLAGETMIARQGASLLAAAGLADWVASTPDEYVELAVARARDVPGLAALRMHLRERVAASPLFDSAGFARNLEDALWAMWAERGRAR